MTRKKIIKIIVTVAIAALTALAGCLGLTSCNVVRTVTNCSEFYQRGDTSFDQKHDNTSKNAIGSCVFRKKVVPLLRISKKSCTFAAAKGNAKRQKHNVSN